MFSLSGLSISLIFTGLIMGAACFIVKHSDFYYNGEEGYELECEQESESRNSSAN